MWRSLTLAIRVAAVAAEGGYRLPVDLVPGPPIPRCSILLHCAAILNGGPMTSAERAECGIMPVIKDQITTLRRHNA
jgi:hypothetical protein